MGRACARARYLSGEASRSQGRVAPTAVPKQMLNTFFDAAFTNLLNEELIFTPPFLPFWRETGCPSGVLAAGGFSSQGAAI